MLRHFLAFLAATAVVSSTAHAQAVRKPYAFGGWTLDTDFESAFQGVTLGVGLKVTSTLGLEGTLYGYADERSNDWTYSYFFGGGTRGEKRTTDRDWRLVAVLRWSQQCHNRACPELLAGGGLNIHHVVTTALTNCDVLPCVAVNELESEIDHTEPLVLGGLDMKVRLNDQFFLVPGVRGGFIFRNDKLTYFPSNLPGRGGPDERAKSLLVISVTAFYRF